METGERYGNYSLHVFVTVVLPHRQVISYPHANTDPSSSQKHLLLNAEAQQFLLQREGWKVCEALSSNVHRNMANKN